MKWTLLIILIAGIVLVAGCTSPPATTTSTTARETTAAVSTSSAATIPPLPAIPDLVGTWSGTSTGYLNQAGYQVFSDNITMNVTGQEGLLIRGMLSFTATNGSLVSKEFAGVVGKDGKTIETIEYPGGFSDGVILSNDEIELIFRDEANPSTVSIDSLRRTGAGSKVSASQLPAMPHIVGNWTGSSAGYSMEKTGYQVTHSIMAMNITEQSNRLFKGRIAYTVNGTTVTKDFAGAFARDGKTLRTVEYPDGFSDGTLVSSQEIELIFRDNFNPSRIAIDSFLRSPAPLTPSEKSTVNLVGKWSGSSIGYMETGSGYTIIKYAMTMNITKQDDRLFKGQLAYTVNGTTVTKDFAAVFGRDGKTFASVEFPDGFSDGSVIAPNEIQLIFRDNVNPSNIAIDTFVRV